MLVEKIGNIKDMIMEQIEDFVLTRIITAGITWLISLLNPAAAFIKACKLIYDVVMFFVTNAARIAKFVNTVIDGIVDIAKGNVSAVVAKIEDALSQMVPILIGFIASVLGIGGIGEKIRSIVQKLQKPVIKALDFVIRTGLKLAGPVIRGLKGIGAKAKAKVAAGKAYVKGKVEAGKEFVKRLFKQQISVDGETHTVEAAAPTPTGDYEITVATRKRRLADHARNAAALARRRGQPTLAKAALNLIEQAAEVKRAFKATKNEKAKRAALKAFAEVVKGVWLRIGYKGALPPVTSAGKGNKGKVGQVGPHGTQGTRGYSGADTRPRRTGWRASTSSRGTGPLPSSRGTTRRSSSAPRRTRAFTTR